ncbi:MAG: helix-turn-helix domain-containing protein [Candidatus Fimadaptatus sp.]|jgi:AraC-like DNA-binding protein
MQFYHESRKPLGTLGYLFECSIQHRSGRSIFAAPHVHEYFEVLLCREGSFRLETGETPIFLNVGDMAVIDPMDVHCTYALGEGENSYMVLKFVPELMYSAEQPLYELSTVSAYMRLRASHRRVFSASDVEERGMREIMERIFSEYSAREFGYALSVRAEIMRLFVKILRDWHEHDAPGLPDAQSLSQLQRAYEYIEANCAGNVTLADVARHCSMSYTAFSRFFSRHAGCSFTDALLLTRVKRSMRLINSTDMSITEIAAQTGFSSTSHYIRCFKSVTGKTPLKYREAERTHGISMK